MHTNINGTDIYFDIDGPGLALVDGRFVERPTVLALHGGPGFDHQYLRPGLEPLRDRAQIIYVDLRGQGRSGRPPLDTCTLEQMADDVATLCERLGVAKPIVFGHSAGGFVALQFALRHPTRVGGLVLCNTSPTLSPVQDGGPTPVLADRAPAEVVAVADRFWGGDLSPESVAAYSTHAAPYYAGPSHMDVPGRIIPLSTMSLDVMQYFFAKLAPSYDVRGSLASISTPTLVITGSYDWVCLPAASRLLAREIRDAKLVEFPDAGHFTLNEDPARFLDEMSAFLVRC